MKIVIVGRKRDTFRYEGWFERNGLSAITSMDPADLTDCDGVILPGGSDITPSFFGQEVNGAEDMDTELDTIQYNAARYCISNKIPLFGICKGIQMLNVAFGGTLHQDLTTAARHRKLQEDQYHRTFIEEGSFLADLYGTSMITNSAHHQGLDRLGEGLSVIQRCEFDGCIEAVVHESLPAFGTQWHPERLDSVKAGVSSDPLLHYFLSLVELYRKETC
jgi:putative glutamine amidotransferase